MSVEQHVIQVPAVVNSNTAQVLVVAEIPLTPPAFKLVDVEKTVRIDDCTAVCDKAIIAGTLIKNITYKTARERDCHHDIQRVCGDVRHCTVEIPFDLYVDVEGSREGDCCQVDDAVVAGEADKLTCPHEDGTFGLLVERAVVKIRVSVVRNRQLMITGADVTPPPLICPEDASCEDESDATAAEDALD